VLGVLEAVVVRVSQFLMSSFRTGTGVSIVAKKEDDVTREVDLAAEEMAYRMLRESFREGGVLYGEEKGVYRWGDERYIFVLDPLDGSLNYAAGIPLFSVSLAAGKYKEGSISDLEYAAVAVPPTGDIYTASPELGARKRKREARGEELEKQHSLCSRQQQFPGEDLRSHKEAGAERQEPGDLCVRVDLHGRGHGEGFYRSSRQTSGSRRGGGVDVWKIRPRL
jgi:myo-inositol-1(or 4)-monophosphatase